MELVAYIIVAVGAYLALFTRERAVVYGWFVLFLVYSLIARLSPEITGDMRGYYYAAETWPPPLILYTLREPIVWFGSSFLYYLTENHVATFLIIDALSGMVVIHAMKGLDDGDNRMVALAPTIISSYVFVLGQQNVLRQHVAFVILLWALAARWRNQRGAIGLFVLSVLAHNATAVLFGYWLDLGSGRRRRYGPLITVSGVILLNVLWPFLRKSSSYTGLDTAYLYIVLALALGLLLVYTDTGRLQRFGFRSPALLNFVGFAPAVGFLASDQFERVAMIFLIFIVIDLYRSHRSLRLGGMEVAHLACAILVLPVFLFSSVLSKLL